MSPEPSARRARIILNADDFGLSAGVNAIVDALSHLGIRHIDTPCTPYRVWQAIQDAKTSKAG